MQRILRDQNPACCFLSMISCPSHYCDDTAQGLEIQRLSSSGIDISMRLLLETSQHLNILRLTGPHTTILSNSSNGRYERAIYHTHINLRHGTHRD